jgi:hypothetical protein
MYWLIIKNNYVIAKIAWNGEGQCPYPGQYDKLIHDKDETIGIGCWYEESENIFYIPTSIPPDYPQELLPPPVEEGV